MSLPPYASPAVPPPIIEKGDIVEVDNLTYIVVKNNFAPPPKQYQFDGQLENGYNVRAWVNKYDKPTVKTKIVQLCQLIDKQYGDDSATIEDALARLLSYGKVFFNCSGHREVDGEKYPSFNVYIDKLPSIAPIQAKIETPSNKIIDHILMVKPMLTLEGVNNMISQELYKAQGEITEFQATIRVAQQLGLDLEKSGEKLV